MPQVRRFGWALLGVVLFAGQLLVAAERPNILLIMADDQGWGDVAYNGHPQVQTPQLDEMAAVGLRFDRFYAAAPVCSPTRGSVLTGRTPNRFACFSWGHSLRPQEWTLAEALQQAGYATGHFGKWHLGSVQKSSPVNPAASGFDRWVSAYNFYDNDPILSREGIATPFRGESSMIAAEEAAKFIREQVSKSVPFFAVVWFGSPHAPHQAAEEDAARYPDAGKQRQFLGEITGLDTAVGALRGQLRDLQVHENTLVWYCSDNGGLPGLGRTGGRAAKGAIYEGGLRVPAIIEWPQRIPQPRTTEVVSGTVDIFPTVLAAAGVPVPDMRPLDGINLLPLVDGEMEQRPQPLGFWIHPTGGISTPSEAWMKDLLAAQRDGNEIGDPARLYPNAGKIDPSYPEDSFPGHAAWLDWPWKLHRIQKPKQRVTWELYRLDKDPEEQRNLVQQAPDRMPLMQGQLQDWLSSVVRSLNGKDYPLEN